jgi:shikimate dehydrogenase
MITGKTKIITHIGFPTHSFRAPMIFNPYFNEVGIDAVVVPMGSESTNFPTLLKSVFGLTNIMGALITMPHKVAVVGLVDEVSPTVKVAGSCNAVRRTADGRLQGDMFDGEGFVRGAMRKGCVVKGASAIVVGAGGVGSAIAASLAAAGVAKIGLFDARADSATQLAGRLRAQSPELAIATGSNDPAGYDIVVNATPLGMNDADPLPMDVARIAPSAFVGEVVMKREITPFLEAARARGCRYQIGTDMLFEQIPAYLEFFGLPSTTADELRRIARISY